MPKTRRDFWEAKLEGNKIRDRVKQKVLRKSGWKVLVIWECETGKPEKLTKKLFQLLATEEACSK